LRLRLARAAAHAHPGVDEGAEEPWPDRALVIRAVALADAALVVRGIGGRSRRERAEADRRLEPRLHRVDDATRLLALEDRERQAADGQDLVRPEAAVHRPGAMVGIDDVVQAAEELVPEPRLEARARAGVELGPTLRPRRADAERVQPERLHLDRLPD